jgi:hypothetical protein
MSKALDADFTDMERKLGLYMDKGSVAVATGSREEPVTAVKPDASWIKPLRKVRSHKGSYVAVDCSTRTLKRANNWGVYLMRATYASVKARAVDWGFEERICTAVGDAHTRSNLLTDVRIELESQMALSLLKEKPEIIYYEHTHPRSNYLLLDGGGYFGGERKFRVALYEQCEKTGVTLLAISKNSPSLHDEKGRDLIATTSMLSTHDTWVCHPVRRADKNKSLYGDISLVKLCGESPHIFRCDIMEYLTCIEINELLSPLTAVAEDPRCLGYPVPLWLAHDFSAPADAKLLQYLDRIEKTLAETGILTEIRNEELSCSFADELHGVRYPFNREMVGDYV